MFQVSDADAVGGPISAYYQVIHPEDVPAVEADIEAALARATASTASIACAPADGRERWVLSRGHVVRNDAGAAMRMSGVVLDISEQRRAEARLRKSEYRRRMALESAELGMWTVDPAP